MKAVILVGGEGTRLRPITYQIPKPMIPLVGMPLIEFVIRNLKKYEIEDIILSTFYMPSIFSSHFGNGEKLGVNITYVTEDVPLGTCGAVKNAEKYLRDEPFLVFNGDIITSLDFRELIKYHKQKEATVTITLTPVDDPTMYGLVPIDSNGRVLKFLEKPRWDEITTNLINAGTYVLEPEVLEFVPEGKNYSFERELFPLLLSKGENVFGFPSKSYWLDLGTSQKYLKAQGDILDRKIDFDFQFNQEKVGIWIGVNTEINKSSNMFPPLVIGENCKIKENVIVNNHSVILNNTEIGNGTKIKNSLIMDNCKIGSNCVINKSIICSGVIVGNNVHILNGTVIGSDCLIGDQNVLTNNIKLFPKTVLNKGVITF
ncbi:MAG: NDP-sugar synthase [Actinomycetota bacterium]